MNARKIKRRIHARMAWHFAQLRFLRQHGLIFDIEAHNAFSFGPTDEFNSLLDSLFGKKLPDVAPVPPPMFDINDFIARAEDHDVAGPFDEDFAIGPTGCAEDGYPYVPFHDEADEPVTYTVARVKDDVVVLTTDDKAAAEEAVAKAARQKRAKLYILETEKA